MNLHRLQQTLRRNFGMQAQDDAARRRRRSRTVCNMPFLDALEERKLLAANINVDGTNALSYAGSFAGNNLTASNSGTTYTFNDPSENIFFVTTNGLPTTGNGSHTVTITGISAMSISVDGGSNAVNIQSTAVSTSVDVGGGNSNTVNVGSGGTLTGIQSPISIGSSLGGASTVTIDDSSDPTARSATLSGNNSSATLSGLAPVNITIDPANVNGLVIDGGFASDTLTVDFRNGNPLPTHGPLSPPNDLYFDGGTAGSGDKLVLLGDPTAVNNYSVDTETYNATGSGQGTIVLDKTGFNTQSIGFINLTPTTSSVVATNYVLNLNTASHQVSLTSTTIAPGSTPAVLIADSSGAVIPTFESTAVANKTNITINPSSLNPNQAPAENDFTINDPTKPAGLSKLTINGGSIDDQFHVIAIPTGVTTNLIAGDGNDTFYVTATGIGAGSTLNANGGTSYDTLNVVSSNASPIITPTAGTTGDGSISNAGNVGAFNYLSIETINLTKPALVVDTALLNSITAMEAQAFNDKVVATFSNPTVPSGTIGDLNLSTHTYAATISWGDTTSSPGWIVANAAGGYSILGSHTYAKAGTYPTSVVITSLGSTGTKTIAGSDTILNVTSLGSPSATFTSQTANVTVAAAPLSSQAVQISGFDGIALDPSLVPTGVVVATFSDSGTIQPVSGYSATINWGDSTSTAATQILSTGTPNGTVFSVYGNHTYATNGVFPVTVTITKTPFVNEPPPGAQTIAISTATILDAPLSAINPQPTVNTTAGTYFYGAIGTFKDANPLSTASEHRIMVDWGDGSPQSVGYITGSTPLFGGGIQYTISGQHTYASSLFTGFPGPGTPGPVNSTFPITIHVEDIGGAAVNLYNTANVAGLPVIISAHLDPASDSGVSNSDGITNVVQPTFRGTANQSYVRILVYASPTTGGATIPLGTTTTDSTGAWSLTSNVALLDGSYLITAIGIDSANQIISQSATSVPNPIIIDTVGPKVTSLFFDRGHGQVDVTYQDLGGIVNSGVGLNQSTIIDANNYRMTKSHQKRGYLVDVVSVSPGTLTGPQNAVLSINGGQYLKGGHYVFSIYSADVINRSGVQDIAGNALDGEYYGYVPTGNNVRGGNLVARLNAIHNTIYAPGSVIGAATPVKPPGNQLPNIVFHRYHPISMPSGKLATRLSTKMAVRHAVKTI